MLSNENVESKESLVDGAGRGLFALKDFAPGDLVVALDRPLVADVDIGRMADTCAWCFQRSEVDPMARRQAAAMGLPSGFCEVKACTGCRRVAYCGKSCQSKAWKREHKYECNILAPSERPDLPEGVRAVIKLLAWLKNDPEGRNERLLDVLNFRPAHGGDGLDGLKKRDEQLWINYNMMGWTAWKYSGEPSRGKMQPQLTAAAFSFNIMCNKIDLISPLDDTQLGIAFDPLMCSANHSCDPNVAHVFNQPGISLRALKPIKKGEELFVRYVDTTNPRSVRQAELARLHHFECLCPKCDQGAASAEDAFLKAPHELPKSFYPLADKLLQRHESKLLIYAVQGNSTLAERRLAALQAEAFSVSGTTENSSGAGIEEVREVLKMCLDCSMWKWTRQPVPLLCRQLFSMYIASGDPYRAFRLGAKLHFEIAPDLHPQSFYADRLIDAWAMATVVNVLCSAEYKDIYDELSEGGLHLRVVYFGFLFFVYDNIPKMYGFDSPFGKVVQNTYQQLMAGIGMPEADLREKIYAVWPSLETIARSVSVQSL